MDLSNPEENLLLVGAVENPAVEGLTLPTLLPKGDCSVQGVNGVQSDDDGQEDNQQGTLLPRGGDSVQGVSGVQSGDGGEGGVQQGTLSLDWVDKSLVDPNRLQSILRGGQQLDGGGFTLDTSLERVFGQGATRLAIEFEGETKGSGESEVSLSDSSSDSELDVTSVSTPARVEVCKKRVRGGMDFGNLSGISELKANHELSSGDESSEDPANEVKKPRLTVEGSEGGSETDDPLGIVAADGDVESTLGQNDEVPLQDPGPHGDAEFSPGGTC